jgi:3-hydroxyisobutyrate dehydrogenase
MSLYIALLIESISSPFSNRLGSKRWDHYLLKKNDFKIKLLSIVNSLVQSLENLIRIILMRSAFVLSLCSKISLLSKELPLFPEGASDTTRLIRIFKTLCFVPILSIDILSIRFPCLLTFTLKQLKMKTFIGTGLLGFGFVRAMISKGEKVQVWNRTATKAKELEQYGAKAFDNIEDAVRGADVVHIALKDDASVDEALAKAEAGLKPGAIIADHTTTSVEGAKKRTEEWKKKGFFYQHAPVFMGPKNALDSTGYMLVSGDQDLIQRIETQLSSMTGTLVNFGDEVGKAAAMKLTGNLFLVGLTGVIADTIAFSNSLGISSKDLTQLFTQWNPGESVLPRLQRMTGNDFSDPSWRLEMARKDTGLMLKEADKKGIKLNVLPGVAALMDEWMEKGHGKEDWTIIGKLD